MLPPTRDESNSGEPTPEMLAGLSVRIEAEETLTVRPFQAPQPPAGPATNGAERPSTEQLAGVYVEVEGPEDLTVHPRTGVTNAQGG
jgi:hypothetical protein